MRIARLGAPLLVAVAAVAAGCGGDDDDAATTDDAGDDRAPTTTPAGRFPATVEHALGTTVVEDEPQRVVTVGVTEQDFVLALGVTPGRRHRLVRRPAVRDLAVGPGRARRRRADGAGQQGRPRLRGHRRPRSRPHHRHQRRAGRRVVRQAHGDRPDDRPPEGRTAVLLAVGRPVPPDRRGARQGRRDDGDHRRHRRPVRGGAARPTPSSPGRWRSSCRTRSTTARRSPTRRG